MKKFTIDESLIRTTIYASLIVIADQLTKYLAVARLKQARSIEIVPGFFNLSYVENPGAAWGILSGQRLPLVIFSVISLIFILWKRDKLFGHLKMQTILPVLICGGIIGNLIDRVRLSHVIDFLDFHAYGRHFPAFNIADSAICIGACLFIIAEFVYNRRQATKTEAIAESSEPQDAG